MMPEDGARFLFTFSAEATKQLQSGNVSLRSGGLRKPDGTMLELAKPVLISSSDIAMVSNREEDEIIKEKLMMANGKLDQMISDSSALKELVWMDYAVNCRSYEMTYQGFRTVISQLNSISTQISNLQSRLEHKEIYDALEITSKHRNNLTSVAGIMEMPRFSALSASLNIEPIINDIHAHFERLYSDLKGGVTSDWVIFSSIELLLNPYCYVVRRYSSLYYYENDCFPANYDSWVEIVNRIISDSQFKKRLQYCLRLNCDLTLEDVLIARDKVLFNISDSLCQIDFEKRYILCHSKEQYLSIGNQLEQKIASNDYQIIDGHLCVEV